MARSKTKADNKAGKSKVSVGNAFARFAARLGPRIHAGMGRLGAMDPERIPLLKDLPPEDRQPALATVLLLSLILAAAFLFWNVVQTGNRSEYVEIATRLQMLSQRYAKTAQQAVMGNTKAFVQLDEARTAFADGLHTLIAGGAGVPSSPWTMQDELTVLQLRWQVSQKDIQALSGQQAALVGLGQAIREINKRNGKLLALSEQVAGALRGDDKSLALLNQQALWTQRMAKNANALLSSEVINPETAHQLGQDARSFRESLDDLLKGNGAKGLAAVRDAAAREKLLELQNVYAGFEDQVDSVLKNMAQLVDAKHAARELSDESDQLLALTQALTQHYQELNSGLTLLFAVLFFLVALGSLLLLGRINLQEVQGRALNAGEENRRNQDAILRLLNEMGDLAEGDLTVQATVTEDITGAIADSVNFAIEELRTLVQGINRAAEQVAAASAEARDNAEELLRASEQQAKQIGQTTQAVTQMSRSIVQVSQNAAESTAVAEQALVTARRGGDTVREAIAGMNAIRDQIQETSKRIKRLGESSQEIGEIVDLISDITEQTNVLALNAAIQAAAAGEAGLGFSVVAEEVQRLAERSAQATRRIGSIVKTIQSDTQNAVIAMETSTQGVVQGTARSDAVGVSLAEIEAVSDQLARLIQNISDATRSQANTAEQVMDNMEQILGVTEQASHRARRSAESVGQLAVLSDELKVSVSGFKL